MFKEMMAENFPELFKDRFKSFYKSKQYKQKEIHSQIHHSEFQDTKYGEKILKAVRGEKCKFKKEAVIMTTELSKLFYL